MFICLAPYYFFHVFLVTPPTRPSIVARFWRGINSRKPTRYGKGTFVIRGIISGLLDPWNTSTTLHVNNFHSKRARSYTRCKYPRYTPVIYACSSPCMPTLFQSSHLGTIPSISVNYQSLRLRPAYEDS